MDTRAARAERARREEKRRRLAAIIGDDDDQPERGALLDMQMQNVQRGVSLTWLHYVFKRDRNTCKILLADCPVLRSGPGGVPIYDVAEAAQYLVKPKLDVKGILKTLKEADLPDDLKPKIWEAKLKAQRWEEKAGDLWRTAKVLDVFSETFKAMRNTMQLWADDLSEEQVLTQAQRDRVRERCDELQAALHRTLADLMKGTQTGSQLTELDEVFEEEDA